MIRTAVVLSGLLCLGSVLYGQNLPPRIFFTDIESGPNTGGENNNGAFVTIYGTNFGTTQGGSTVTVGGGAVAAYKIWGQSYLWYQKIAVQLGPGAATGNIVVTTSSGSSNGMAFTVRAGKIYFVAQGGSDSNAGSTTAPWATIPKCKNTIAAGDICYVKDGVNQLNNDNGYSAVTLGTAGTATNPLALLTYPGAVSTIGSSSTDRGLMSCKSLSGCSNAMYWVVGGFQLTGVTYGADLQTPNMRLVGNHLQCPYVKSGTAEGCLQTESSSFETILGNEISNVGAGGKLYHAAYFGADGHFEVGWNSVHDVLGCRGMQWFNSSIDSYNISLHDNLLYNIRCDAINLATVDASKGYINIYNNVVYHSGIGPDPGDLSNYTCMNIASAGSSPTANAEVYNNTLYDCGARGGSTSALMSPQVPTRLRNNVFYSINNEPYFQPGPKISGSNNLFYGNGTGPSLTTANVNSNPLFTSSGSLNFHLLSGSPAIDSGVNTSLATDRDGVSRPQGGAVDIGAYEFAQGTPLQTSRCDLNGDGVVNQTDANAATAQALGTSSCSTADLDGNGKCDVVDVQRVINAAAPSGVCRVGP